MPPLVRVCIAGAGRAGRVHASSLVSHVPAGQLVAIVDPVTDVAEKACQDFGIETSFGSLEDALDWGEFEAVIVTTPTFTHRDLTVAAAAARKHVFLEKPMALTLAECDEMMAASEQNGIFLQLGFMRRFDPDFIRAFELIRAGQIGRPMIIKSLTHGPGLPPPWAWDLQRSNGMLAEVNSHDWDTARWFMDCNPERVYTEVANFKGAARGIKTKNYYDNLLVTIRFSDGGLGSISGICPCEYGYDARVEIIGEKGIMRVGDMKGQAMVMCTDRDQGLVTPTYRTWSERFAWAYIREMEHFVDCVQKGVPPSVDGSDGRWAVACVLAATRSFLEERPVHLNEVTRDH